MVIGARAPRHYGSDGPIVRRYGGHTSQGMLCDGALGERAAAEVRRAHAGIVESIQSGISEGQQFGALLCGPLFLVHRVNGESRDGVGGSARGEVQ